MSFRRTRTRSILALLAVLSFGFVLMTSGGTSLASQGASTSTLQEAGLLRLHLGSSGQAPQDYLGFQSPDPAHPSPTDPLHFQALTAANTQAISTSSGCKLSLTPSGTLEAPGNLVTFSAVASTPNAATGFVGDAIGVGAKNEGSGQPCGRVDAPSQVLTMNLGAALSGKVIDYAEIDLEGKFGASVTVRGFLGSDPTATATEIYDTSGPDSGPDSADLDNFRIRFPLFPDKAVFTRLEISVSAGAASLEGGADGTDACDPTDVNECADPSLVDPVPGYSLGQSLGTEDTLFHLIDVDGLLDCGDSAQQSAGGITTTIERLPNEGSTECGNEIPILYNQDSFIGACDQGTTNQCIVFQKDLLDEDAQFYWSVTWAPESGEYQESPTRFDFGNGYQDLQFCLMDSPSDPDSFPELPPSVTPGSPDPDPWCVVFTSTTLDPETGEVTVFEQYFGKKDPGGSRH